MPQSDVKIPTVVAPVRSSLEPDDGESTGLFGWWRVAPPGPRRALVAALLGWALDMFDVSLYALVLASVIEEFGMAKSTAGLLGSLTLVAGAFGGLLFGLIADRYGRVRAMVLSIIIYSIFTGACGLAQSIGQLALFRFILGLGMGGEWATGASLVSETWPKAHRGKALGLMQTGGAVGRVIAAAVTALVLPYWGWRAVFFVGVLPALVTIWIRRRVAEPEIWQRSRTEKTGPQVSFGGLFRGRFLAPTCALTLMNGFTMFAFWGLDVWIPAYLMLSAAEGGIGLSAYAMSLTYAMMQVGKFFGYVTFGFVSDRVGRKRTYVTFLLGASLMVLAYTQVRHPAALVVLGMLVSFFGSGHFTGFGVVTAEIYPTSIRVTAQGFTYNVGRLASAVAPFTVGAVAQVYGFGAAMSLSALAYLFAAGVWFWLPETRGRSLDAEGP